MLLEILNNSFNELFFIKYFKDSSNRNFEIIELNKDFIVNIFFVVEIKSYFRLKLMLSSSFKISENEKRLLILQD